MSMGDGSGRSQSAHARPSRRWGSSLALAVLVAPSLSVAMTGCGNPQDRVVVVVRDRETKEPVQDARIEFAAGYALLPNQVYRGRTDHDGVARMNVDLDQIDYMKVAFEHREEGITKMSRWDLKDGPTPYITGDPIERNGRQLLEFSVYRDPDFPPSARWLEEVAEREHATHCKCCRHR
jgi:hypothetical protein